MISADGRSRYFRVLDITNIRSNTSPVLLKQTAFASGIYAHSMAVSEDFTTLYTFEEFNVYDIGVYDLTSRESVMPQLNSFSWSGEAAAGETIVHNGHIRGNYLVVAYYEAGLRVFDVSNPLNPLEVGKYETWRDPDGDGRFNEKIDGEYHGAWNLHLDLPSGNVLVSDRNSGLFIVKINPVPLPARPAIRSLDGTTDGNVRISWSAVPGLSLIHI